MRGKQVVEHRLADHHDLEVERYRLGFQGDRRRVAHELGQRFDPDLAVDQRPLELFPGIGLGQQLAGVDDQEAAVGLVQRARLDQREVGDQGAEPGGMLDPSDQVGDHRRVLDDHRRAVGIAVVDQDVDLVPLERGRLVAAGQLVGVPHQVGDRLAATLARRVGRGAQEVVDVVDDVVLDPAEESDHLGQVVERFAHRADQVRNHGPGDFAIELDQLLARLFLPGGGAAHGLGHALLQRLDVLAVAGPLLLGQLVEHFGLDRLAVAPRREHEAVGAAQDQDALLARRLLQLAEGFLVALLERLLDGGAARLVLVGFEGTRDAGAQVAQELDHRRAQRQGPARRQPQGDRLVRLVEIVDVADVGRLGHVRRRPFEEVADDAVLAGAGLSQAEQVVALALDADAEADRLDRAGLADDDVGRLDLVGGLEAEAGGVASPPQRCGREGAHVRLFDLGGHGSPSGKVSVLVLDALHVGVGETEMVTDFVNQHISDHGVERRVGGTGIPQDWLTI